MTSGFSIRPWPADLRVSPEVAGEFTEAINMLGETKQVAPWCSYLGEVDGRPVAMGGFKGVPDDAGAVEIGYLTFVPERARGYATQFAGKLVEIALREGARAVTANTMPEENASTAVLRANGFVRDGEGEDDDIGRTWCWRLGKWGEGR